MKIFLSSFVCFILSMSILFVGCSEQVIELLDSKIEKYLDKYETQLGIREESDKSHKNHTDKDWKKYALEICEYEIESVSNKERKIRNTVNDAKDNLADSPYEDFKDFYNDFIEVLKNNDSQSKEIKRICDL